MTSLGSRQLLKKPHEEEETPAFGAVDGSSHRHRERLLTVPSGWKRIACRRGPGARSPLGYQRWPLRPFWPILASSMNQTWISFPGCWVLTASISAAKFFLTDMR
jgi:hypothetical protein